MMGTLPAAGGSAKRHQAEFMVGRRRDAADRSPSRNGRRTEGWRSGVEARAGEDLPDDR